MKIISIVNQKGGCGKTITAVNLSAGLSKKGFKVLLIDLDPQAHATFALRKTSNLTITDILEKMAHDQPLPQEELYQSVSENFYFIGSRLGLASLEHKFSQREDRLDILSSFLNIISSNFDYCVIDCPPNLGLLTLNALNSSTYCLIPFNLCDFSLRGIEILKDIIIMLKEFKDKTPICFYLLNQLDRRSKFACEFTEKVKKRLGSLLLDTMIRTNITLKEAASCGKNIFEYDSDSRGAIDFAALSEEMIKTTSGATWAQLFLKGDAFGEVYAIGDFNNWQKEERYKLRKVGDDIWSLNIPLEKGKYRYKFLTGDTWISDPHNKLAEDDSFGGKNSLIIID